MFELAATIMLASTLVIMSVAVVLCYRISNSIYNLSESVRNLAAVNANLQHSGVVCVDVPEPVVSDHVYTPVQMPLAPLVDNESHYINQPPYVNMRSSARNRHSLPCRSTSYVHMVNAESSSVLSTTPYIDFNNYLLPDRSAPSLLEAASGSLHRDDLDLPISSSLTVDSSQSSIASCHREPSPFYP